jgi:hypothetical protein
MQDARFAALLAWRFHGARLAWSLVPIRGAKGDIGEIHRPHSVIDLRASTAHALMQSHRIHITFRSLHQ